jgi:hypothetical protein
MSKSKKSGECVYCGTVGVVTNDHVPPKCLFPPEKRRNLITVKACQGCHDSFKLDDEYFRLALSVRPDLPNKDTEQFLFEKTIRSLQSENAKGLRASVIASVKQLSIMSPDGAYLGDVLSMQHDFKRLEATAARIIVGLYSKFLKTRLPQTHAVKVHFTELPKYSSAIETPEIREIIALLGKSELHKLGDGIVEIRYISMGDDNHTVWFVRIFETFIFFGFTYPSEEPARKYYVAF